MKTWLSLFALLLAGLLLYGCGSSDEPQPPSPPNAQTTTSASISVTDDFGRTVTLAQPPQRIVSLAPNITEILYALGLGDRIVGVTDFCDYPPEAKSKSTVGRYDRPSIEKIVSFQPDVALLSYGNPRQLVSSLENFDIPAFGANPQTIDEIFDIILQIGTLCDVSSHAEETVSDLRNRLSTVEENLPTALSSRPKVFIIIDEDSLWTAGANTLQDEILHLAGGENIASSKASFYPISKEILLVSQPDLILVAAKLEKSAEIRTRLATRDDLAQLNAVKRGDIAVIDGDIFSRSGPRVVDAVEQLAQILSGYQSKAEGNAPTVPN